MEKTATKFPYLKMPYVLVNSRSNGMGEENGARFDAELRLFCDTEIVQFCNQLHRCWNQAMNSND